VKLTVRKKDVFELEENENNFLNKKSWKPCGDYKKISPKLAALKSRMKLEDFFLLQKFLDSKVSLALT
jgi:hypothetical protein